MLSAEPRAAGAWRRSTASLSMSCCVVPCREERGTRHRPDVVVWMALWYAACISWNSPQPIWRWISVAVWSRGSSPVLPGNEEMRAPSSGLQRSCPCTAVHMSGMLASRDAQHCRLRVSRMPAAAQGRTDSQAQRPQRAGGPAHVLAHGLRLCGREARPASVHPLGVGQVQPAASS